MTKVGFYQEGEYVKYTGDYSIKEGPLRNEAIGQIVEFKELFGRERVFLSLIEGKQEIWCDYDKLRPISTTILHLEKAGFKTEELGNEKVKRFVLGPIIISGVLYRTADHKYVFSSGFCLGDLTHPKAINWKKYRTNGDFDVQLFYGDFPSLNNINSLFEILDRYSIRHEKELILLS